jgi:soluble lytic murein transglycosylase
LRRSWLKFTCLFIIFFSAAVLGGKTLLQAFYPIHYAAEIEEWSHTAGVDPYLTAALIQVESGFRPDAVSPKGAIGLMQIMPETARWIGEQNNIRVESAGDLFNPGLNIQLGTLYLAYLMERFATEAAALAAYNGGLGNVRRWLNEGIWDGQIETANQIPFAETRAFVRKLQFTTKFLRLIYHGQW